MSDTILQEQLDKILEESNKETKSKKGPVVTGEVLPSGNFLIAVDGWAIGIQDSSIVFSKICSLLDNIQGHIIINLKKCTYLSSIAIGDIAKLAVKELEQGYKVVFIEANDTIKDLIKLTGLNEMLSIFDTLDEALEYLSTLKS